MKTRAIVFAFACFVLALGSVSASAEPQPPDAGTPPAVPSSTPSQSCELEKAQVEKRYDECRGDKAQCEEMQKQIAQYAIDHCDNFSGMTVEQVIETAKVGGDPPKRPGKTTRRKKRHPPKPAGGTPPPPAATPRVKVKIVIGEPETQAPGPLCKNGSLRVPIGLDDDGDGTFDPGESDGFLFACKGDKGDPGKPGAHVLSTSKRFSRDAKSPCSAGGVRTTAWTDYVEDGQLDEQDGEKPQVSYVCDGKSGSAGRPGANGNTRVQFGLYARGSAIWSEGRPTGYSLAPEAQLELWLSPTVEFVTGIAWAPQGDRNMVVTALLRRRALDKRVGLGFGVQYQAWNLEGNKALWQTVTAAACGQLVLVEGKWIDLSADACALGGLDGYDEDAQAAFGVTGSLGLSLKL